MLSKGIIIVVSVDVAKPQTVLAGAAELCPGSSVGVTATSLRLAKSPGVRGEYLARMN